MRIRNLKNADEGVVGIVVAILLIGLLVSVVSFLQVAYVPKWMEEIEADHMDEVATQFAHLKFAIDAQSVNEQLNTPIATSITLGSRELPFLVSSRAFGHIEILPYSRNACVVNITYNNTITGIIEYSAHPLGIIKYSSVNAYFIDQSYIYETGALITSQQDGNMISVKPSFSVSETDAGFKISFTIVNISDVGGKISNSGYGSTAILTEFLKAPNPTSYKVHYLNITTMYPTAWALFLNWSLKQELTYGVHFSITVDTVDNSVIVKFNQENVNVGGKIIIIDLKLVTILAQIGPGWIE